MKKIFLGILITMMTFTTVKAQSIDHSSKSIELSRKPYHEVRHEPEHKPESHKVKKVVKTNLPVQIVITTSNNPNYTKRVVNPESKISVCKIYNHMDCDYYYTNNYYLNGNELTIFRNNGSITYNTFDFYITIN